MPLKCAQCRTWKDHDDFSNNQLRKGEGAARCAPCVIGYHCPDCDRSFNNSNELKMHAQVHRPKTISCPICGQGRYASAANAVQHFESGYCVCCPGRDNARQKIFEFTQQRGEMRHMLASPPLQLGYQYGYENEAVPDLPYACQYCDKMFKNLSQLMQHCDNRHNSTLYLT